MTSADPSLGSLGDRFAKWVAAAEPAMVAVTASDGEDVDACLVGFHSQASIDPPRYVVWLSEVNHTSAIAARCDVLGVHLLRADQHALAERLGAVTAAVDRRKLDGVALRHHPSGAILLDDCTTWFVGRVLEPVVGGDHTGALLDPVDVSVGAAPAPLRLSTIDFSAGHPVG